MFILEVSYVLCQFMLSQIYLCLLCAPIRRSVYDFGVVFFNVEMSPLGVKENHVRTKSSSDTDGQSFNVI